MFLTSSDINTAKPNEILQRKQENLAKKTEKSRKESRKI